MATIVNELPISEIRFATSSAMIGTRLDRSGDTSTLRQPFCMQKDRGIAPGVDENDRLRLARFVPLRM